MTAAEVLEALSIHGVRVLLGESGRPEVELPDGPVPAVEGLLAEARAHRDEIAAELRRNAPPCPSCGAPVSPDVVLCGACYAARRAPGRVLAFDPARRPRTLARLDGRQCGTCGATDWNVNGRGDATCRGCFPDPSSPPAGSVPDAPSLARASEPDRRGVSRGGRP